MAAQLGAVLLAAGASQRMGTAKALLPWGKTTLLEHAIQQARAAGIEHLVVVLGPATAHLTHAAWLTDATVRCNPDSDSGRSASIRIGTAALPDWLDALVVQSVDQPCPGDVLATLLAVLESAAAADIAIPTYAGRRGHPVCFSGRLLPELRQVREVEHGLRSVVRRYTQLERVLEVAVNSPAVAWNLNDAAAYAAARLVAERM